MGASRTKLIILLQLIALAAAFMGTGSYVLSVMNRRGVVKGILYTMDNNSIAQIDDEIYRVGDSIDGIKVTKIERGYVEFKKGQYVWQQKVCQKPGPEWRKDEYSKPSTAYADENP